MIIVLEGVDNVGKDTLISSIESRIREGNIFEIHCRKPFLKNSWQYQLNEFSDIVSTLRKLDSDKHSDINTVILNRSWLGELVYGVIYRGVKKHKVLNMIGDIETEIMGFTSDVKVIHLRPSDANFVVSHDDGKSLSGNELEKIENEISHFDEAIKSSMFETKTIVVDDGHGSFRDIEELTDEAIEFICRR